MSFGVLCTGYVGMVGSRSPGKRPQELPRARKVQAREVRPKWRGGEKKAPLCSHTLWNWPSSLHWTEVLPAGNQALPYSLVPEIYFPACTLHGEAIRARLRDSSQLQAWR